MAKLAIHPIGLAVTVFGLLAWIIGLGGIGAATYGCQKTNSYEFCAKTYQVGPQQARRAVHGPQCSTRLDCKHHCLKRLCVMPAA